MAKCPACISHNHDGCWDCESVREELEAVGFDDLPLRPCECYCQP